MKHRSLALAVLVTACGTDPGVPARLYEPAARHTVAEGDGMITYASTDTITPARTLRLRVRWPDDASGPLPAVVLIHGGGFNDAGHTRLPDWGASLAAAGYVAIHMSNTTDEQNCHCAALQIPAAECMPTSSMREVIDGGTLPAAFYTRPRDASAVLDRLDDIARVAGIEIDTDQVAVLGHSGGSHAVMALAGADIDVSPSVGAMPSREPRFRAFVANSPQGVGRLGLTDTSWDPIASPMLIQTGRNDSTVGEDAPSRLDPYPRLRGPDVYQHYLDDEDSTHEVFALDHAPGVEGNERALATTAIAFLDAHVRGRAEAIAWLASDALVEATAGASTWSRKER